MFSLGGSPAATNSSCYASMENNLVDIRDHLLNFLSNTVRDEYQPCYEELKRRNKICKKCDYQKSRESREIKKTKFPEIVIDSGTQPRERKERARQAKRSLDSEIFSQSKEKIRKDNDTSLNITKDNKFVPVEVQNKNETKTSLPSIDRISYESRASTDDHVTDWKDNSSFLLNNKDEKITNNKKFLDEISISKIRDEDIISSTIYKKVEGNPTKPEVKSKPEQSYTSVLKSKLSLLKTKVFEFLNSHKQIISGLTIFVLLSFLWYFVSHQKYRQCTNFRFCVPHSIGNKRKFF